MGQRSQMTLLFLLICICSSAASQGFTFTCKEAERKALLQLKHSFIDESNHLGSWVGQDCCNWKGVGCDQATGHVIKLDLRSTFESRLEASEVNPALLELKYLSYLDLSGNSFNSSRIPEFFGSMRHLQYLNLSSASFGGEVSLYLGNLTKLVVLDLCTFCSNWEGFKSWEWDVNFRDETLGWGKYNLFYQEVETNNLEWAFKLENLQYLDLSGIKLSQALDTLDVLHKLPSLSVLNLANCGLGNSHIVRNISSSTLQHLDLQLNSFHGSIPHFIQNLSSIRYLSLAYNYFNGSFPHSIQYLSFLTSLDLSHNGFSSSIPSWLANKTHLEYLFLSGNHFTRMDGGIMNNIYSFCSLKYMDLSHNQLQEEVSKSDVNFRPRCSKYDLQYLYMKSNNISGYLPIIGNLSSLLALDLSYNKLEGLPPSLGGLSSLEFIVLSHNNLIVVHQVSLANLSSLTYLDLSSNPTIFNFSHDWMPPFQLKSMSLLHCKLNSPFPRWVLSQKNISQLDLSDTGIFGPLPNNIGTVMPSLTILRLASNHINGSIPRSLFRVGSLDVLHLQNNRLSGMIPDCDPYYLVIDVMDLSSNKLSGPIPECLIWYSYSLRLSNNSLGGGLPLVSSFIGSSFLQLLDVSMNNLHGEIPPWNGTIFDSLGILILRENGFEGVIPLELCSFQTLRLIDFANNNLAGTIPQCFGYITAMSSGMWISETGWSMVGYQPIFAMIAEEVIKGKEREYTTILDQLISMDLSCNHFVGVIPAKITNLSLLLNLNLSHNHFTGNIPVEIGKMKSLESLDFSYNNLSGSIPESISSLDSLSTMNLSFNNLGGPIPTGRHLETLDDPSIYMGNPGLCGDLLPVKCFPDGIAHPPTSMVLEDEGDDTHEKMWFYLVIMLGYAIGFWGVIGMVFFHSKLRFTYSRIAEELADWIYDSHIED